MVLPRSLSLTWQIVADGGDGPGPRSRHGLVYDSGEQAIVLFGGVLWVSGGRARLPADTWELRDGVWQPIHAPLQPRGRHRAAMVHDDARGISVLFGGQDRTGAMLGETWIYAGRRWRAQRSWWRRCPSPRCGHAMAYDEGQRQTVLFGGIDPRDRPLGDTWVFDGSWHEIGGPGPPMRRYAALAYDPGFGGCVLHGGAVDDLGRQTFGDAWLFRDRAWSPLPAGFATDPRDDHGLAYHRAAGALVMLEGVAGARGILALSPAGWHPMMTEPLHPRHQCSPLAWDNGLDGLVLHGGEVHHRGPQYDETLVLRLADGQGTP
jgi:hypothetical protein